MKVTPDAKSRKLILQRAKQHGIECIIQGDKLVLPDNSQLKSYVTGVMQVQRKFNR